MRTDGRYARQSVLPVIGSKGQRRFASSTILIVGCGALGSTQAELVVRAGVGKVVLVDRDILELHNLQRQLLFCEQDVRDRLPKAVAAARRLQAVNSAIRIEGIVSDVAADNVLELVRGADVVLDGTDNFETRFLINDAAVHEKRPWVYGGVLGTDGMVMTVRPGEGPCLRCVFPDPPDPGTLPTCETQGVLNTAVTWVAALQVTAAFRILVGDPGAETRLHAMNVWEGSAFAGPMSRNPDCVCCGKQRFEFLDSTRGSFSTVFCGRNAVQVTPARASVPDFNRLADRLRPLGAVAVNGLVLEFTQEDHRLVVFPDGRVLVMGTTDTAAARNLVAKYIGS